jgi:hypothetical protein
MLAATWTVSQRGDGDAGWIPHWETHFYQNKSSRPQCIITETTVDRLTRKQEFGSRQRDDIYLFPTVTRPPSKWATGLHSAGYKMAGA